MRPYVPKVPVCDTGLIEWCVVIVDTWCSGAPSALQLLTQLQVSSALLSDKLPVDHQFSHPLSL